MTTAAAWQRTINNLDPDAFGRLVAEEVLATAGPILDTDGGADAEALPVLVGMGALAGFRRLVDAATLEALTGELEGTDQTADDLASALTTTIQAVAQARAHLLHPGGTAAAVDLLTGILDAWKRAQTSE